MFKQFERLLPRSEKETGVVQQRLIRAGYRKDTAVKIFYGTKVFVPLSLAVLVFVSGLASDGGFMLYIGALGLGFLAPDFWLGHQIESGRRVCAAAFPMFWICWWSASRQA